MPVPEVAEEPELEELPTEPLTAVTVPDTGANKSETAFTDSTEPKVLPATISEPTLGSSTKTMSPSEFCA